MTLRRLVIAIAFLGIFYMASRPMIDTDTWWHLRTGQWILEHQALPDVDQFSFTRIGQPWYYPGWLAEIIMVKIYSWGGLVALNFLFTGLLLLAFAMIYLTLEGDPFLSAAVLVVAAGASEIYWSARPQVFTFFFSACFYLILRKFMLGKKNFLWLLPLIMLFWVNIHPGFAVGFILLLIAIVGQGVKFLFERKPRPPELEKKLGWLVGILFACLVTAVINPRGIAVLAYPFQTVSIEFLQNFIQEWQTPDFHFLYAQMFLILFFITWTVIVFSPKAMDVVDFFFIAFISYMGFLAWRNTNLLSIVAPAIIMLYGQPILQAAFPKWNPDHSVSRWQSAIHIVVVFLLTITVAILVNFTLTPASIQATVRRQIPVTAVEYLSDHPDQGRMLNSYNWGSYLLWNLPSYPVFVDGRTDLYDDEILYQYLQVAKAQPGWRDVLDKWEIQVVFLEPTSPVLEILISEGWTTCYQDSQAVILHKPNP
jgi:hypothetical protein